MCSSDLPPQLAERRVTFYDPRIRNPSISRNYLAPSQTKRDGVSQALTVLANLLSGSTGRFYQELVVKQNVATGAGAGYAGGLLDDTTFSVFISPRRGIEPDVAEKALDAEIEKLLRDGVTEQEVALSKAGILDGLIFARDNVMGLARRVGNGLSIGLTVDEVTHLSDIYKSVTVANVNAAAKLVFDRRRSATGLMLPQLAPAAVAAPALRPAAVEAARP